MSGARCPSRLKPDRPPPAAQIDALLPQTQCRQCGFEGCLPYATSIHAGLAKINRCPPGGTSVIAALAALTGRTALPLDPDCGSERPFRLAVIDESQCIGCTLCIQACPVDAIIGAPKRMHAVVDDLCTGCELCIAPCPVDCIAMAAPEDARPWGREQADAARERFHRRNERLARQAERAARASSDSRDPQAEATRESGAARRAVIQAAITRARAKRPG